MSYHPCKVEDGLITLCPSLGKAIVGTGHAKGLNFVNIVNVESLETVSQFVSLKGGELPKQGIVINWCPFCGTNLSDHLKVTA